MGILFHIPIPFLTLQLARQTAAKFLCQDIQGLFFFFFLFSCDSGEAPTHPLKDFKSIGILAGLGYFEAQLMKLTCGFSPSYYPGDFGPLQLLPS